jgi:hypothetical protein
MTFPLGSSWFSRETEPPMSRYSGMSPKTRRAWGIGIIVFFVVMCGMIAWSQWYAIHVNVPKYESKMHGSPSP